MPLDFHAIINLQVTDAVTIVKNFGPNWYKNNVEQEFAQQVRQAVVWRPLPSEARRAGGLAAGGGVAGVRPEESGAWSEGSLTGRCRA